MRTIFYVFYAFKPLQFVLRTALSSRFHPFGYSSSRLGTVRRHDTPRPGPKMRTFIAHLRAVITYRIPCAPPKRHADDAFLLMMDVPRTAVYIYLVPCSTFLFIFLSFGIVPSCVHHAFARRYLLSEKESDENTQNSNIIQCGQCTYIYVYYIDEPGFIEYGRWSHSEPVRKGYDVETIRGRYNNNCCDCKVTIYS